ncbi:MAG TPA: DUF4112 domain-containing protein [Longimicrobiales bacterium]|nr:DUF4112 domain-containing protein [Longimicrobiales bacterium]
MTTRERELTRLRAITRVMDEAIGLPGTRFRIGLDGLLGLVPGVGDALAAGIAGYALLAATRLGAPRSVLARMAGNIALDTLVGAIPVLGDLFDFAFKANRRNLRTLEHFLAQPERTRRASRGLIIATVAALVALLVLVLALAILLARAVIGLFS